MIKDFEQINAYNSVLIFLKEYLMSLQLYDEFIFLKKVTLMRETIGVLSCFFFLAIGLECVFHVPLYSCFQLLFLFIAQ